MEKNFTYSVTFSSSSTFEQMKKLNTDETHEVEMFFQEDDMEENPQPEVIFLMQLPEDFNDGTAQFSIRRKEAKMIIDALKSHFEL